MCYDLAMTLTPGFCSCGCGNKTKIAPRTHTARGWVRGVPQPYLRGHSGWKSRGPRWIEGPIPQYRPDLGPCWIWQRFIDENGYGRGSFTKYGGGKGLAHIGLYEQMVGPVPKGLVLDHLCRVTACVRPSHLEPVTDRSNILRGAATKLTDADVARAYSMRLNGGTWRAIAEELGVKHPPLITRVREFCERIGLEYPASENTRARAKSTSVSTGVYGGQLIDPNFSEDEPYRPETTS